MLRYHADSSFAGSEKITAVIPLGNDGNEFTSTWFFDFLDANGNTLGSGYATELGTRF